MKNNYISKLILLVSFTSVFHFFSKGEITDSLKTIEMNTVVVSANKTDKPLFELTVPAKIITKQEIKNSGFSRLDEIINEQIGIVTVPGYGGSEGVQIQGIDPDYILILVDGLPVIGRVAGILDLSRISLANVERVEIIKGASSALYGSEALGGVINIITESAEQNKLGSNAYYQFGSFNTHDVLANIRYKIKNFYVHGNINSYSTDGFDLIEGDDQKTVEAFNNLTGSVGLGYDFKYLGKIDLGYKRFSENRDGTVFITSPGNESQANTSENNFSIKYRNYLSRKLSVNIDFYHSAYENVEEKIDLNNILLKNNFLQSLKRADIRFKYKTLKNSYVTIGLGQDTETMERTNIISNPEHESKFTYVQYDWKTNNKLNIVSGLRFDSHKNYNSQLSPKISAKYSYSDNFFIKGSFGYGYKTPDFRQLYLNFVNSSSGYIVLGTKVIEDAILELKETDQLFFYEELFDTNLLSESSNSLNLGFQYYINPNLPVELNLFRNNINNLIESNIVGRKMNGQTIYSYSNLNKVGTQGLEIQASWLPIKNISVKGGYQILYAKDKSAVDDFRSELVYARDPVTRQSFLLKPSDYYGLYGRSRHQLNLNLNYYLNESKDNFNLRINYRGKFGLRDTNNNAFLDKYDKFISGHFISNLSYNKKITKNLSIQFFVRNIMGYKDVENLLNNPGRRYSLKFIFNN